MNGLDRYPHVGIVIINWNRPEDTTACLRSLEQLDYPSHEVVVVDNGSTDGSPALLRERFPELSLIENGRNLGFCAGNNIGIAHLLRKGAQYVMLLNDDTEVHPDLLRTLVQVGESDPRIGILGPKIYYYDPANVIWSAGGAIDRYGRPRHLRVDQPDEPGAQPVQDVDYVTGCAFLVKRHLIETIGVLDERFFIYFEESEWCARARRAGFRVAYVPQAWMWHKISPTARETSRRYLYLMTRNRLLYLKCSGARPVTISLAILDLVRTAASWSLRARHRRMRRFSGALLLGVRDYLLGRFWAPPVLS